MQSQSMDQWMSLPTGRGQMRVRSWGRARKWDGTGRPIRLGSIDEWWVLGCVIGVLLCKRITRETCEQHHHNERRRLYKHRHIMSRVMGKGAGVAASGSGPACASTVL